MKGVMLKVVVGWDWEGRKSWPI